MENKILYIFVFALISKVTCDEVGLVIGGQINGITSPASSKLETFSHTSGFFKNSLPSLPEARQNFAGTFLDGKVYVCGGFKWFQEDKSCLVLDLKADKKEWKEIAPMIKGRAQHSLIATGGKIYAIGGETFWSHQDNMEVYDPKLNTWTMGASFLSYRLDACAVASEDGKSIYLIGGYDEEVIRTRMERFDIAEATWTKLPPMTTNRTSPGCLFARTSKTTGIIVAGGWTGNPEIIYDMDPTTTVEFFDIKTGTWSTLPSMQESRTEFGFGTVNGNLTSLGGRQRIGHQKSMETLVASEKRWKESSSTMSEEKSGFVFLSIPKNLI